MVAVAIARVAFTLCPCKPKRSLRLIWLACMHVGMLLFERSFLCLKGQETDSLQAWALFDTCHAARAQVGMLLLAGSCGGAMLLPMLATIPGHILWRAPASL